ncbi:hypothetical protein C8F01DRAFT_1188293 [Mycena amicta]|nr:hypothetical protein C8F01DRAFT_1188293 [Mycena amicta]
MCMGAMSTKQSHETRSRLLPAPAIPRFNSRLFPASSIRSKSTARSVTLSATSAMARIGPHRRRLALQRIGSHPTIIAHAETLSLLASLSDPLRPLPSVTFEDKYTLKVGNQTLELSYHGPNHTPGNLFMYAPVQRVALLIDVIFPGWAPFAQLGISDFIPGWTAAHDVLLALDFDVFVAGHVGRLGTKQDVLLWKKSNPGNAWAEFKAYFRVAAQTCADNSTSRWLGVLAAVDVFAFENAYRMIESLRVEYDVLGPFGVS